MTNSTFSRMELVKTRRARQGQDLGMAALARGAVQAQAQRGGQTWHTDEQDKETGKMSLVIPIL